MPDLNDGQSIEMQGSGSKPYVLKNVGGVYSCTCPAWRNQSLPIERRTCKHLRKLRGDAEEEARIGAAVPATTVKTVRSATEPPLLLAERWESDLDLTGWWMSEKLDGVRAYWDGKQFISRLGNPFHAPDWFVAKLPDVPLDGELWMDRKAFQRTISVVKRQDRSDHWKQISYVVFDAPALGDPFEKRVQFIDEFLSKERPPFARAHIHEICKGVDHLQAELARIEGLGGEGLMMRQPGSKYAIGRSCTLLKVKTFHDAEAKVVAHLPGKGRHKGRLGAVEVVLDNGTRFSLGTGFSDAQREAPPAIGSIITFRYQELSDGGVPRFPSFVGLRTDRGSATPAALSPAASPPLAPKAVSVTVPESVPVRTPAAATPTASTPATSPSRYFEFVSETSSKFWEVWTSCNEMTTRWGRIGSGGQLTRKSFATEATARAAAEKLIAQKTSEGYVEKPRPGS